jgi:hypothetical protein
LNIGAGPVAAAQSQGSLPYRPLPDTAQQFCPFDGRLLGVS